MPPLALDVQSNVVITSGDEEARMVDQSNVCPENRGSFAE